jgi:hypothetical protein
MNCNDYLARRWTDDAVVVLKAAAMLLAAAALVPTAVFAQARGTTSQGMFGQQSLGNPSGVAPSGMGTGITTGLGANGTNASQPTNTNGMGLGNSLGLGQSMQQLTPGGTTGFVGASANTATNILSRQGQPGALQGGRVNFGSLGNLMNQSRQNQFNQQQAQRASRTATQAQSQFRVPLRLGFVPSTGMDTRFSSGFSERLTHLPGMNRIGSVNVGLEGRTAVLRGTVATEDARQLAEGLARLEPEVLAVRNELVVTGSGTRAEPLPAAPAVSPTR